MSQADAKYEKPIIKCGMLTAFDEKFVHDTFEKLKKVSGNLKRETRQELIECLAIHFKWFDWLKQLKKLQLYHKNISQMNDGRVEIDIEFPFIDGQLFANNKQRP